MSHFAAACLVVSLILPGRTVQAQAVSQRAVPAGAVISGIIRDASGGAIVGASVTARVASGAERQTTSDAAGRFSVARPVAGEITLIVRATGFAEGRQAIAASAAAGNVEVLLQPATVHDEVTVTPTRSEQQLGMIPASASVIGHEEIRRRPSIVPDDLLRQLPEFSLFRRSSSLSAHPTSQGVSLREIGRAHV